MCDCSCNCLTGDDARRLVEYIENPTPPPGHNEYLRECDRAFREDFVARPANELFGRAADTPSPSKPRPFPTSACRSVTIKK